MSSTGSGTNRLYSVAISTAALLLGTLSESTGMLIGSPYFTDITTDVTKNLHFDDHSPLCLSASSDGNVVALSGVIGESDDSFGHAFKILTFMKDPGTDNWITLGDMNGIVNQNDSDFGQDARADISLSGDGKRLAVSVVYKTKKLVPVGYQDSAGFVRVYSHSLSSPSQSWSFVKTIYDGDAGMGGAEVGLKVSLDDNGTKIVIGEMYHDVEDDDDHNVGRVMVYDVDNGAQLGSDIIGMLNADHLGTSVAMSRNGQCFVHGAIGFGEIDTGAAYVFCWDSSIDEWVVRGSALVGEGDSDKFGYAVAISNDGGIVAVGGYNNDVDGTQKDAGHVRVFGYNDSSGSYDQIGQDIDGEQGEIDVGTYYVGEAYGYDVAISDLRSDGCIRTVVGAPNNNAMGYYLGEISILESCKNNNGVFGNWTEIDDIYGDIELAGLGFSVTIDSEGELVSAASSGTSGTVAIKMFKQTEVSSEPSSQPSGKPSTSPSSQPSLVPSALPSVQPSTSPSYSDQAVSLLLTASLYGLTDVNDLVRDTVENTTVLYVEDLIKNESNNPETTVTAAATILSERNLTMSGSTRGRRLETTVGTEFVLELETVIKSNETYDEARVKSLVADDLGYLEGQDQYIDILQASNISSFDNVTLTDSYIAVGSMPSASPSESPSSVPSGPPSTYLEREFHIRTTYDKFDFSGGTTWCATPKDVSDGSIVRMRPCKSYTSFDINVQLWKRTVNGIRLARPGGNLCLMKNSLSLRLGVCGSDAERFNFNLDDDNGTISIIANNGKWYMVGYDPERKFSQLRLYQAGASNPTLTLWETAYGNP